MISRPKLAILLCARSLGLFALARQLTRSRLRILCYHGGAIGDESQFNPKLFCSAATLRARMAHLRGQGFGFVTLGDGLAQQAGGSHHGLRTVITFDDGWYSTGSELLPVLSAQSIPSTLYLSTKNFLEGWPILTVTVRYIVWKTSLPAVSLSGWGLEVDGRYDLQQRDQRERLVRAVIKTVGAQAVNRDQVCALLVRFGAALGVSAAALDLESRRFDYLSADEVREIAGTGCNIELHGHVHDYPAGDAAKFADDLQLCARTIVGLGLAAPRHYCYPSGEFNAEASHVLSSMGIDSATTCVTGLVTQPDSTERHYLPRFLDGEDVHLLQFDAEMSGFSELARTALRWLRTRGLAVAPSSRPLAGGA